MSRRLAFGSRTRGNAGAACADPATSRLNWRIVQIPMRLVGYVVGQELVHLRHHGHGPDYWQAVDPIMLDYERRREELRQVRKPVGMVAFGQRGAAARPADGRVRKLGSPETL